MRDPRPAIAWSCALAGALALHVAVVLLLQTKRHFAPEGPVTPKIWRVSLRLAGAPAPLSLPDPLPLPQAVTPPSVPAAARTVRRRRPATAAPTRQEPPVQAPDIGLQPTAEPPPLSVAEPTTVWLDASQLDSAPTPEDNLWQLAQLPWPTGWPRVRLRVWVSARGQIEQFELEGSAATDPAMRQLFAPIVHTPMRPALHGGQPVASILRVEMWPGDSPDPDFVAPIPLGTAPR